MDSGTGRASFGLRLLALSAAAGTIAIMGAPAADASDSARVAVNASGDAQFAWRSLAGFQNVIGERRLIGVAQSDAQVASFFNREAEQPEVGLSDAGRATFVWSNFTEGKAQARRRLPDGTLAPVATLATGVPAGEPTDVGLDHNGNSVLVWSHLRDGKIVIQTRVLRDDGTLTAVQALSATGQDAHEASVAVTRAGVATYVWQRSDGANTIVQTRTRAANGTLSGVQNLSATGTNATEPVVAVDTAGDATFAWTIAESDSTTTQTRRRTAGGVLGAVQDLGGIDSHAPAVAVTGGDDAAFAWLAQVPAQERTRNAAGTFTPIKDLSTGPGTISAPDVGVDTAGNATFGWTRTDGGSLFAEARRRAAATGALGTIKLLSPPENAVGQIRVSVAPGGDAVFAWEGSGPIEGRRYRADGSLGPALVVSP